MHKFSCCNTVTAIKNAHLGIIIKMSFLFMHASQIGFLHFQTHSWFLQQCFVNRFFFESWVHLCNALSSGSSGPLGKLLCTLNLFCIRFQFFFFSKGETVPTFTFPSTMYFFPFLNVLVDFLRSKV